jgi:uncharacterized Fe-S cluster protein YjdI
MPKRRAFFGGIMGRKLTINLNCTNCGETIFVYDGRQTIPVIRRCPNCNRFMRFYPETCHVEEINKIERTTSSGARFY